MRNNGYQPIRFTRHPDTHAITIPIRARTLAIIVLAWHGLPFRARTRSWQSLELGFSHRHLRGIRGLERFS